VPELRRRQLFGELERGVSGGNWSVSYRGLFGAPLDAEYMSGGCTSHLAAALAAATPEELETVAMRLDTILS